MSPGDWWGIYYCGHISRNEKHQLTQCGPTIGPSCASCKRHILNAEPRNTEGEPMKLGSSGLLYCGRKIEGDVVKIGSNGLCGPDVGIQCKSCDLA